MSVLRSISLGAGVQSTTLVLMAAHGEIGPMPDCAIMADTKWEPKAVYDHLAWLASPNVLPFPVHVVTRGSLRQSILDRRNSSGGRFAAIPWFTVNPDGSHGMGRRQCTSEYKLTPIMWKLRELLGKGRRERIERGAVEIWIGISLDEAIRKRAPRQAWQIGRWPLLEKEMTRSGCYDWLEAHDYPVVRPEDATAERPTWPPKSACLGCPFHDDAMWAALQDVPDEWADVVEVDTLMREGHARGFRGIEYMHAERKPIGEIDFSLSSRERRMKDIGQTDMFLNECEGMCGL
jgi:hypothetical protein